MSGRIGRYVCNVWSKKCWILPVDAAAECDEKMWDSIGVLYPGRCGGSVGGAQVGQLPGVGDPPHTVAQDEHGHDGQADLGVGNLLPSSCTSWSPPVSFQTTPGSDLHNTEVKGKLEIKSTIYS